MLIESNGFKIGNPHIKTNLYDIEKHIDTIKKFNVSISDFEGEGVLINNINKGLSLFNL